MEEQLDLGKYIEVLLHRRYLVLLPALLLAVAVGGWFLLQPTYYQARVLIVPNKLTTEVSFDTAIKTVSEGISTVLVNRNQRLASLVELAHSPDIARTVLVAVAEKLPAQEQTVDALLGMVKVQLVPQSDLIEIQVTGTDPQLAADIVNLWSDEYIHQINTLYGDVSTEPYANIQRELPAAKVNYERAQTALEALIRESRVEELQRRIDELNVALGTLSAAQQDVLKDLLGETQRMDRLLQAAQDMRDHLQDADDATAASSALALSILKLQTFTEVGTNRISPSAKWPYIWQIQPNSGESTQSEMLRDLDHLLMTLQTRRQVLDEQVAELSEVLRQGQFGGLSSSLEQSSSGDEQVAQTKGDLERQLRGIAAELEYEQSLLGNATAQRDLAWEKYNNLVRKESELALAVAMTSAEVRLGTSAGVAIEARGLVRGVAIAALAGLMLGILAAFLVEFWQSYRNRAAGAGTVESSSR